MIDNKINLYISPTLKDELSEKLHYFGVSRQTVEEVMNFIEINGILVEPTIKVRKSRDSEDNYLLELAETAKADYLITRDKDLLSLPKGRWKITKIIMPETFLPLLRTKKLIE